MAWSDRDWILDGANVRVSIVGFDDGSQKERLLDNLPVEKINANLTSEADTTLAVPLHENARICFIVHPRTGVSILTIRQRTKCSPCR
jgi:hypothetical protein